MDIEKPRTTSFVIEAPVEIWPRGHLSKDVAGGQTPPVEMDPDPNYSRQTAVRRSLNHVCLWPRHSCSRGEEGGLSHMGREERAILPGVWLPGDRRELGRLRTRRQRDRFPPRGRGKTRREDRLHLASLARQGALQSRRREDAPGPAHGFVRRTAIRRETADPGLLHAARCDGPGLSFAIGNRAAAYKRHIQPS